LKSFDIRSVRAMEALGGAIARATLRDLRLYLSGDLAAGKTTLARGYLRARGYAGAVKSPTFTLVETYALDGHLVHHFDLYRIADPEELEYIGADEYFDTATECLVEWPERGEGVLPPPDLEARLEVRGNGRLVGIAATSDLGYKLLEEISNIELNSFS
jgi:tRNA threonylcarbamoyladenosine biosynthesis protein TsaE